MADIEHLGPCEILGVGPVHPMAKARHLEHEPIIGLLIEVADRFDQADQFTPFQ
jgi:hypothetical protein